MKVKNRKFVFIGEDGEPEKNDDGSLKVNDLYRGFLNEESYTKQFEKTTKNLANREKEALKKYNDLKKEQEIDKLLKNKGIDSQFVTLVKKAINKEDDIKQIEDSVSELLKNAPRMKKVLDTGGSNPGKNDGQDDDQKREYIKIIG